MKYRIVLDTNQYVSALIKKESLPDQVLKLWKSGSIEILVSPLILQEIERVLSSPKIRRYLPSDVNTLQFMSLLNRSAYQTHDNNEIQVVTADPTDNKFIACAVEGNADIIVTGDKHLLDIGSYQNIRILTPRMFLDEMKSNA